MIPKNPLDAILSEVLGDDGGLLLTGMWAEEDEPAPTDGAPEPPARRPADIALPLPR